MSDDKRATGDPGALKGTGGKHPERKKALRKKPGGGKGKKIGELAKDRNTKESRNFNVF